MHEQTKWRTLIEPILVGTPYELVGVVVSGGARQPLVRIYMDKPGGINIDEIAKLTREIGVLFDVHEPIKGKYTLEVSSPGVDRPLFLPKHFQVQCGQTVKIKTHTMRENQQNFKGLLQTATDEACTLVLEDGKHVTFSYDDIEKAKVVI